MSPPLQRAHQLSTYKIHDFIEKSLFHRVHVLAADSGEFLQQIFLFFVEVGRSFDPDNDQLVATTITLQ